MKFERAWCSEALIALAGAASPILRFFSSFSSPSTAVLANAATAAVSGGLTASSVVVFCTASSHHHLLDCLFYVGVSVSICSSTLGSMFGSAFRV